jgi:hypothetical protein
MTYRLHLLVRRCNQKALNLSAACMVVPGQVLSELIPNLGLPLRTLVRYKSQFRK